MIPESDPGKIDTPYGALYLAVMPAKMDRWWDIGKDEYVTGLRPRIRVATDPTFEADPAHADHFTIHGRAYGVHRSFYFWEGHISGDPWQREDPPYQGGYRNAQRQPVKVCTPTYSKIDAAVIAALDAFATDNPEWDRYSAFLYWEGREHAALAEADDLRDRRTALLKEADEYRAKAIAAQGGIDAVRWRNDSITEEG
jgi:hypothetical protein